MQQVTFKSNFTFSTQLKTLFKYLLIDGSELRVVGGAVRNSLITKVCNSAESTDIDLACNLKPEEIISILTKHSIKTIPTGIKYGTITAIIDDQSFQITTLRKETNNYGRHCQVEFIDDFYQDALRRDFTINSMSIDCSGKLYDYFQGKEDLSNKIVRFIGDADSRIKEDYLRILRFFRFTCFYGEDFEVNGLKACIDNKNSIKELSLERITDEFLKILSCQNRDNLWKTLSKMYEIRILQIILSDEIKLHPLNNLFILEKSLNYKFEPLIILAALSSQESLLSISNAKKKYLQSITKPEFVIDFKSSAASLLKILLKFDQKIIIDSFLINLIFCDNFKFYIDDFLRISKIISTSKIPHFPINGNDLIALGVEPRNIGKTLEILKESWLDSNFTLTKSQILLLITK